jgi:hypothetical protein
VRQEVAFDARAALDGSLDEGLDDELVDVAARVDGQGHASKWI